MGPSPQWSGRRRVNLISDSEYCVRLFEDNSIKARCNKPLIRRVRRLLHEVCSFHDIAISLIEPLLGLSSPETVRNATACPYTKWDLRILLIWVLCIICLSCFAKLSFTLKKKLVTLRPINWRPEIEQASQVRLRVLLLRRHCSTRDPSDPRRRQRSTSSPRVRALCPKHFASHHSTPTPPTELAFAYCWSVSG